jgi:hypothetical protein
MPPEKNSFGCQPTQYNQAAPDVAQPLSQREQRQKIGDEQNLARDAEEQLWLNLPPHRHGWPGRRSLQCAASHTLPRRHGRPRMEKQLMAGASPPATEALIESALPPPASQRCPKRSKVTARPGGRPALRQSADEDTPSSREPKSSASLLPSLPQTARGGSKRDEKGHRRPDLIEGAGLEDARRRMPTASSGTGQRSGSERSPGPLTACSQAPT